MRLSSVSATSLVLLVACGSKAPSPSPDDAIPTPEQYEAPPAPCPLVEDAGPTLALPWRGGAQTFLEAGTVRDTLALDYDVWPRPHVDRVRVGLDFDRIVSDDVLILDGACPRVLDLAWLRASVGASAPGDVARAVVIAEDEDRSRRGELFFTTGARTLRVAIDEPTDGAESTDGDELADGAPTDGPTDVEPTDAGAAASGGDRMTLLLFEPAWGEPRVALRVVDEGDAAPWSLEGLPEGPGLLAWVELDGALRRDALHDAEHGVVYLPGSFAQDWIAFARSFRARSVVRTDDDAAVLSLELGSDDFDHASLGEALTWDGARDLVLVTADASNLELPMELPEGASADALPHGRVSVPCAPFELVTLSHSEVFVTLEARPEVAVGAARTFEPTCTEGSTELSIRVRSTNARDTRILLRGVARDSGD